MALAGRHIFAASLQRSCSLTNSEVLSSYSAVLQRSSISHRPHPSRACIGASLSRCAATHSVGRLLHPSCWGFSCRPQPFTNEGAGLLTRSHSAGSVPFATRMTTSLTYPEVRRDETVVDDYHGTKVADPYRWLEDPDSEETKQFVERQNELTQSVLKTCDSREQFKARMTDLFNYPKIGCPSKKGSRYFFYKNSGLQAQYVLYMQASLEAEPEVLLDPNTLSEDGTVALGVTAFSEDGKYFAYGLSASGSDWQTIHVLRVEDKVKEPDVLKWVKFSSLAWTHDGLGFFYGRYPEPSKGEGVDAGTETDLNLNHELCYHVLGTPQSEDVVVWEEPDHPKWIFSSEVTDDGRYLLVTPTEGCDPVNRFYYYDLQSLPDGSMKGYTEQQGLLPVVKLIDNFDALYSYVSNDGTIFTLQTNKDAPMNKVVRVDLSAPGTWADVIAESAEDVLEWAVRANRSSLLVAYLHDVKSVLQLHDLATGAFVTSLPLEIGSITSATVRWDEPELFYSFSSFLTPSTIFRADLSRPLEPPSVFLETEVKGFDRSLFETRQVFVPSKDGTKVPMFVVMRAGLTLDGSHPTLLYGYGGFNVNIMPQFSVARLVLVQHYGAIAAVANIRGGGEYGERWHKAGALAQKQNCFDDFISCGEYLIKEGYTKASKLAIEGGSNGGLLVAACINQRPDLFGCALPHVGVMDMLRFHKFTIGHAWTSDYGCADSSREEFDVLYKYSPLHNVKRPWESLPGTQYPPVMILTADHDDRVVPLHSLKLLATLQHECCGERNGGKQTNPVIARIDTKAGHGAGRPTKKVIEEYSDTYSFMAKMIGASWQDPLDSKL